MWFGDRLSLGREVSVKGHPVRAGGGAGPGLSAGSGRPGCARILPTMPGPVSRLTCSVGGPQVPSGLTAVHCKEKRRLQPTRLQIPLGPALDGSRFSGVSRTFPLRSGRPQKTAKYPRITHRQLAVDAPPVYLHELQRLTRSRASTVRRTRFSRFRVILPLSPKTGTRVELSDADRARRSTNSGHVSLCARAACLATLIP